MLFSKKGALPFIAIIVIVAILVGFVMLYGGSGEGDEALAGDAKSIGKNSRYSDDSAKRSERVSIKDRIRGIVQNDMDPYGYSNDDLPEMAPEEDYGELVDECLEGPPPYLFDSSGQQIPTNQENCEEWADSQINAVSHGGSCSGGSGNRYSHAYMCGQCTCLEYDVCFCEEGQYNCNTGATATNEVC